MKGGEEMKEIDPNCVKLGEVEGEGLIEVSVSKVNKWRKCQKLYSYRYDEELKPKKKAVPLRKGSWVHSCLEALDNGQDWLVVLKDLKAKEYDKLFEEEKAELGDLPNQVLRMLRAYQQTYKEVDKEWETIVCEQQFMIRIPNTNIVLVGRIDKIARNKRTGKVWCFERKTMKKSIPTDNFRTTDIQTAIYLWVLYQIAPKFKLKREDVAGVMFDYIRTKPPTVPHPLKNGQMSQAKIDTDKWTYLSALKKAGLDPKPYVEFLKRLDENVFFVRIPMAKSATMLKITLNELISTANQIQMLKGKGIARSLNWTCDRPRCDYRDLCIAELQGLNTENLIKLNFTKGDEEDGPEIKEEESDD
jgi:hypothetical protein